jgi:ubiquinone/menaquinone biosynthesis C-methylase UbiE
MMIESDENFVQGGSIVNNKEIYNKLKERGNYWGMHWGMKTLPLLLSISKGSKSVLDVGCGKETVFKDEIERLGYSYTGIDIVKFDWGNDVGDITNLPYDDGNFDLSSCTDVLEHLEETEIDKAILQIKRVSRKGVLLRANSDSSPQTIDGVVVELHKTIKPFEWWKEKFSSFFADWDIKYVAVDECNSTDFLAVPKKRHFVLLQIKKLLGFK